MNILFTLNANYIPILKNCIKSIVRFKTDHYVFYVMHSNISPEDEAGIKASFPEADFSFIYMDKSIFQSFPKNKRYPQEMYYRLLAGHLLPPEVERVLYLDPDILVINPLRPLWETALDGHLFAACAHTGKTELVSSVNRVRLGVENDYFNSGVLLMDLARCRREIVPQELFDYAAAHMNTLILPDQDMLNALFGDRVLPLSDVRWNYDARDYHGYFVTSGGEVDMDWIMAHTAILHFCGKAKPWKRNYRYRFGALYKHYEQLTRHELERA